jgi:hypothetical protein
MTPYFLAERSILSSLVADTKRDQLEYQYVLEY